MGESTQPPTWKSETPWKYYFSPRAGNMDVRRPPWKHGPISLRGICLGNKSRRSTRNTRARKKSSQSGTRRNPNSNLASEWRLMDQPCNWSLRAIVSCDQPRVSRHLRTCGPIRFNPILIQGRQTRIWEAGGVFPR